MLELFPVEARERARTSLVFDLQAVIVQKLLKSIKPDIPRIPAVEVMIAIPSVRKMISQKKENERLAVIRASYQECMQDFSEALHQLVRNEFISAQTAYDAAPNPDELRMKLMGITVSGGGVIG